MNNRYYLCMNTGGTSSDAGAFNLEGVELFRLHFGVGSPAVDYDEAIANILDTIEAIYQQMNRVSPVLMVLGISGVGAISDLDDFKGALEKKYHTKVEITNDAIVELYGIMGEKEEVILSVAGTGNATVGVKNGLRHLVGGGGPLLKEEGSCYSAVLECSLLVKDDYEKRIALTPFLSNFLKEMNCPDYPALKAYFYNHTKAEIARHATFIIEEAGKGTPEAIKLVDGQAFYLVQQVKIMKEALNIENGAILGLYGGFTHHNPLLLERFNNYLKTSGITLKVCTEEVDPLKGAFNLAKQLRGE